MKGKPLQFKVDSNIYSKEEVEMMAEILTDLYFIEDPLPNAVSVLYHCFILKNTPFDFLVSRTFASSCRWIWHCRNYRDAFNYVDFNEVFESVPPEIQDYFMFNFNKFLYFEKHSLHERKTYSN